MKKIRSGFVLNLFVCLLIFLLGSSCSKLDSINTNTKPVELVSFGQAWHIEQLVTAKWQNIERRFICVLEIDDKQLSLAGMDENGFSLFNLFYDVNQLVLNKDQLLNVDIDPIRVLNDLQMIYWPVESLRKSLDGFSEIRVFDNNRVFYDASSLAQVEVKYIKMDANWPIEVDFFNNSLGYSLHILTTKYESLY